MTIIEKPEYFKKYRGRDGKYISLGDTVFGEDGKAFEVEEIVYEKGGSYPITGREMRVTYQPSCFAEPVRLKPKWLSHKPKDDAQDWHEWLGLLDTLILASSGNEELLGCARDTIRSKMAELELKKGSF